MTGPTALRPDFRPEIQGIRTIGALLVAVFHIWLGRVSGGVDVFFVISGFLITGSLCREVERTGTIGLAAFWGRIAKRVAPVGYFILTLTAIAAFLWMPRTRWEGFLSEVVYSAFHLENVKLMLNAVDYLAREEAPSPVQQFWALSVQVQFYAVWPFLLLACAAVARRLGRPALILAVLGAVFAASLAYSVLETAANPSQAYFNPGARVWEFALGGVVAVALPHLRLPPALRAAAGWLGLALVVSCGFVLPASAAFPGYVALWPTLGAALVILSGGARTRFGVDRILAARPLVALGDISFSFYLWHWPVLVFYLILIDKTQAGIRGGLGVIAVSLLGAFLTHRLVEAPIHSRLKRSAPPWHPHAVAVACVVPVLAFAAVSLAAIEEDPEEVSGPLSASLGARSADYPGGALPVSLARMHDPKVAIYPSPATAKRFTKPYRRGCHQKGDLPEVITCSYGVAEGAAKTVAVVGGSHSVHWIPAFEILAGEHRWHVVSITKSACPFEVNALRRPSCIQWNEDVHRVLEKIRPDVVFTTSTRSDLESPTNADGVKARTSVRAEAIPEGYLAQWKRLADNGITVIAVRDNPRMGFDVPECVEKFYPNLLKCARPRDRLMDRIDPAVEVQPRPENVAFIDLTDRFCDDELCYPVAGNVLIYRDKHHIGSAYARTLAPVLGERMKEVRPDLFDGSASPRREAGVL